MNIHEFADNFEAARKKSSDLLILGELVEVLAAHPGGLRRWSVMRAIRGNRDRASRAVSLKFESEVERVFRGFCASWGDVKFCSPEQALFYRPEGKAGEVWAVHTDRAGNWLPNAPAAAQASRQGSAK